MLRTNWYNYLRIKFRDYGVRENYLLGAKGAKIAIVQQKGSLKWGPKSENQQYLSKYASLRSKNWKMFRTNQYNYVRKKFRDNGVRENQLLGAKGAKIAIKQQKGSLRRSKSENQLYLSKYTSLRSQNCQMFRTNWYNYFRIKFRDYGVSENQLLGAKGKKIAIKQQKGSLRGSLRVSKIRKSAISEQIRLSEVQKLANVQN